ncbi:MAG: hypothetical protein JWL97_3783 [Gemmatimonadales bacterium]|nr:hypothetical protein [Gemmatimonadales bacterium]
MGLRRPSRPPVGPVHPVIAELQGVRESRGLSQEQVATTARLSRLSVVAWERGQRAPRLPELDRYARALGHELTVMSYEAAAAVAPAAAEVKSPGEETSP